MLTSLLSGFVDSLYTGMFQAIAWLLGHTVLYPYTFSMSGTVPYQVWSIMRNVAMAGAVILLMYEGLRFSLSANAESAPSRLLPRAGLALLMVWFSYDLLNIMLQVNNALVTTILDHFGGVPQFSTLGNVLALAHVPFWESLVLLMLPISLLFMCFSWCWRVAELVLFLVMSPIAAVLTITERFSGAWRWVVGEFASAAFSQAIWALTIWLFMLFFSGTGVIPTHGGVLPATTGVTFRTLLNNFVGVAFVVMSFSAQSKLKAMLFNQVGTSRAEHGALEMAAAYAGARAATGMWGPQIDASLGAAGIGRYSEGGLRAQAWMNTRRAQTNARPEFAVPTAAAQAWGQVAAMDDPGARHAMQVQQTMGHAVGSHPMVAAAAATEAQAKKGTQSVWTAPAEGKDGTKAGQVAAKGAFARMYPPNPFVKPEGPPPLIYNPNTGHTFRYIGVSEPGPELPDPGSVPQLDPGPSTEG